MIDKALEAVEFSEIKTGLEFIIFFKFWDFKLYLKLLLASPSVNIPSTLFLLVTIAKPKLYFVICFDA